MRGYVDKETLRILEEGTRAEKRRLLLRSGRVPSSGHQATRPATELLAEALDGMKKKAAPGPEMTFLRGFAARKLTPAQAKRVAKNRRRSQIAKASRRANRGR